MNIFKGVWEENNKNKKKNLGGRETPDEEFSN